MAVVKVLELNNKNNWITLNVLIALASDWLIQAKCKQNTTGVGKMAVRRYFLKFWQNFTNRSKIKYKPVLNDEELTFLRSKLEKKLHEFEVKQLNKNVFEVAAKTINSTKKSPKFTKNKMEINKDTQNGFFLTSYLNMPLKTIEIPQLPENWTNWSYWTNKKPNVKDETNINNSNVMPKLSRHNRQNRIDVEKTTDYLLNNLASLALTDPSHIKRLEEFCSHLYENPDTKGYAIRQKAIGLILG